MSKITKLVLLCMLTAVSLPSTAQQLIDLQGNSTLKTSQPAVADIKATVPMRNVTSGDRCVTVSYTFRNALLADDPLYEGCKWWKVAGFGFESRATKPSVPNRVDYVEIPKGSDYKLTLVNADYTEFSCELTPAHPELINGGSELSSVTTDTGGLKPGIYIATMIVDGNIVNSIKFTVS